MKPAGDPSWDRVRSERLAARPSRGVRRHRRRSILGKIGLVLAIIPYVFLLVMINLNPG